MSQATPHTRVGWLIAVAALLATTNLLACETAARAPSMEKTARLNLPSSIEPAKHAPKQYRSKPQYDPDYEKHPSRWRRKLRARYA